ncbi:MAG: redoxin domain-containing protein [Pyrinomonadaceae bacterium]
MLGKPQAWSYYRFGIAIALSLMITGFQAARAQGKPDPIRWAIKIEAPAASLKAGDRFNAQLIATIDEGWHLYSPDQSSGGPLPTRIKLMETEAFKLAGDIDIPPPQVTFDPVFKMETQIFEGEAMFMLPIVVNADAASGEHMLAVSVTFQSCNQTTCLPPKAVKVTSELKIVAGIARTQDKNSVPAITANTNQTTAGAQVSSDVQAGLRVGAQVPDFTFTDFNGKARKFSDFRGNYVLIDFWATWCKPCLADIPHLKALYEQYKDKGFAILGMDSETLSPDEEPDPQFAKDTQERAKNIVKTRGASWTHATSETAVPVAVKVFGVGSLPTQILIDRQGKVVTRIKESKELDQILAELLGVK